MNKIREAREHRVVVDNNGHCFLCLAILGSHSTGLKSSPFYSLKCLTRYLHRDIDIRKVMKDKGRLGSTRSKVKVQLCDDCGNLNKKFEELYRELEKAEMELASCLLTIHAKGTTKTEAGQVSPAMTLREETMRKCSDKLNGLLLPRVGIAKMTFQRPKIQKQNLKTSANPKIKNADKEKHQSIPILRVKPDNASNPEVLECEIYNDAGEEHGQYPCVMVVPFESAKEVEVGTKPKSIKNPITGKHKCSLCSKEFIDRPGFLVHYKRIHLKIKFKCKVCGKEARTRSNFICHYKASHMRPEFKCDKCGREFTKKMKLLYHQKVVCYEGKKPASKLKTDKRGEKLTKLKKLKKNHPKLTTDFSCDCCGLTFNRKHLLERHVLREHKGNKISNNDYLNLKKTAVVIKMEEEDEQISAGLKEDDEISGFEMDIGAVKVERRRYENSVECEEDTNEN